MLKSTDLQVSMVIEDSDGQACMVEEVTTTRIKTRRWEQDGWWATPAEWKIEKFDSREWKKSRKKPPTTIMIRQDDYQ